MIQNINEIYDIKHVLGKWLVYSATPDKLKELADFYSDHYGIWSKNAPNLSGKIKLATQLIGSEEVEETIMNPGDFVAALPNEIHALKALEPSTLLVLTRGPRGGKEYETDTFRLETPLLS